MTGPGVVSKLRAAPGYLVSIVDFAVEEIPMKRFLCHLVVWSAVVFLDPVGHSWGQTDSKLEPAPSGFASRRDGIERGKVETVEYDSKSVGDTRKMMVYLPPGYSKDTNTRSSICCTAPVITKAAGPGPVQPISFSTISSPTRRSSP